MTKGFALSHNYNDKYWKISAVQGGWGFIAQLDLPPGKYIADASFHYHVEIPPDANTVEGEHSFGEAVLILSGRNTKTDFDLTYAVGEIRGNTHLSLAAQTITNRWLRLYVKPNNYPFALRVSRVRMSAIACDELTIDSGDSQETVPGDLDYHEPTFADFVSERLSAIGRVP